MKYYWMVFDRMNMLLGKDGLSFKAHLPHQLRSQELCPGTSTGSCSLYFDQLGASVLTTVHCTEKASLMKSESCTNL